VYLCTVPQVVVLFDQHMPVAVQGALPAGSTDILLLPHIAARSSAVAPEPAADPLSPGEQVCVFTAHYEHCLNVDSDLSCIDVVYYSYTLLVPCQGSCDRRNVHHCAHAQVMSAPPQHVADGAATHAVAPATAAPASLAALVPGTDIEAGPPQPVTLTGMGCA
jgi:hypothetical protein